MTEKYLREWYRGVGIAEVRMNEIPQKHLCFSVPLHIWFKLVISSFRYIIFRCAHRTTAWIRAEQQLATCLGVIQETYRQASHRQSYV